MQTTKITPEGKWLRSDAAASYNRMIAAGMPTGGISAQGAGRTRAVQLMLYALYRAGKGNLAAFHSLHEQGIALDMTRGTPAQRWMCVGGDPFKVTATGSIRANEFGWSRTVPSEAWHFSYDPTRDKHREAITVSVKPGKDPKVLALGVANCQSYDGDNRDSAWLARGRLMAAQQRNVWCVTETTPEGRKIILEALGANWKPVTLKSKTVAVLFDSGVFSWRPWKIAGPWSDFGHGSVKLPLWHKVANRGFDVTAHHTRPAKIATDAEKDADIAAGAKLSGKWPSVIAGDFARNSPALTGWTRATANVDTMDRSGDQRVDAAFVRGLVASNPKVINPGPLSDHLWLTVDLAPGADPTL